MKQTNNMKPKKTIVLIFVPGTLALWWVGLIFILILVSLRCNTTEPTENASLTLSVEDVSCTEAWIMLKLTNISLPTEVTLYKNNSVAQNNILCYGDTLLYFDSLLPKQTYRFQAISPSANQSIKSNEITAATMDTTSHNFTFQSWTFGTKGSSSLYDVAIIDENNIIAVGEVYTEDSYTWDSLGNWIDPYNVVQWDGNKWELKRIYYKYNGNNMWGPIRTIFAFSENDIWYGTTIHWNGQIYEQPDNSALIGWSANKLWGSSSNDLYAVGNNGNIAHWNGRKWTKIESGTNVNIVDISGIQNDDGNYIKYCAADNLLLKIDGDNNLTSIAVEQGMFLNSVWAASNRLIYTAGNGIVLYRNESWQTFNAPEINTIYRIKGQSFNNIVGLSANLSIFHFNGYNWNSILTGSNNIYLKIQIKNNTIATVGWNGDKALITLLFRN